MCCHCFGGRPILQTFHDAPLQFFFQLPDISSRIAGNVRTFGNVSSDELVPILHAAFFPEFVGVAEVNLDAECPLKLFVADEQDVIVPRYRFHFRVPPFHPPQSVFERTH